MRAIASPKIRTLPARLPGRPLLFPRHIAPLDRRPAGKDRRDVGAPGSLLAGEGTRIIFFAT